MGIPLLSGREFTRSDNENAPVVAIVNETLAAQYWRGANPVGSRLQVKGRWMSVVGVAKDSKYRTFLEPARPFFYVPLLQNLSGQVNLQIRTRQRPETITGALVKKIHELDPSLAPSQVITMREQVNRSMSAQRIAVALLGAFGGLALILAAIGLYAVISYAVSQSSRELGLRMALGARPADLLRLVISDSATVTFAGVLLGSVVALAATRPIAGMLYRVNPHDPLVFSLAFVVMSSAAVAACLIPARRAVRTDPLKSLRE
jgi:predicted permease